MTVRASRININTIEIIPHPYAYLSAVACRIDGTTEWYDCRTGQELPPFYGYGADAQQKINEWSRHKQTT